MKHNSIRLRNRITLAKKIDQPQFHHKSYTNMSSQPQESPLTKPSNPPPAPQQSSSITSESSTEPSENPATTTKTTSVSNPPTSRLTSLQTKKTTLQQTLSTLKAERAHLATQAKLPSGLPLPTTTPSDIPLSEDELLASALKSSNVVIKNHIALLHKYNEIKDIGQGLMGLIADKRDCRIVSVMEEFGVEEGD